MEQVRGFMSYYAEYRKECFDIDTFEDENGLFATKSIKEEKRLHIEEMWVKPELRNKKIGQEYQSKIFKYAKENGYERVSCTVNLYNKHANETLAKFLNNNWKLGWTNGDYIGLIKEVV